MKVVATNVNFIQAKGLNHRQFQNFLSKERESEHGDVIYHCNLLWSSCAKVFNRIDKFKNAIQEFITLKNRLVSE